MIHFLSNQKKSKSKRRLLILGKLWDHLQVDKLLADVAYETETTDTDFVEKKLG